MFNKPISPFLFSLFPFEDSRERAAVHFFSPFCKHLVALLWQCGQCQPVQPVQHALLRVTRWDESPLNCYSFLVILVQLHNPSARSHPQPSTSGWYKPYTAALRTGWRLPLEPVARSRQNAHHRSAAPREPQSEEISLQSCLAWHSWGKF